MRVDGEVTPPIGITTASDHRPKQNMAEEEEEEERAEIQLLPHHHNPECFLA